MEETIRTPYDRRRSAPAQQRPALRAALLALALAVAGVLSPGVLPASAQEAAVAARTTTVNINTADAETLASGLKGVGYSRAQEIVRYREAYGSFGSVEELMEVNGIGPSTLEANRQVITLE